MMRNMAGRLVGMETLNPYKWSSWRLKIEQVLFVKRKEALNAEN